MTQPNSRASAVIADLLRIAVGVVLLVSVYFKSTHIALSGVDVFRGADAFASALLTHRVLPDTGIFAVAHVWMWAELAVALVLLFVNRRWSAALGAAYLSATTIYLVVLLLTRGNYPSEFIPRFLNESARSGAIRQGVMMAVLVACWRCTIRK
jgi:hypothetical protein